MRPYIIALIFLLNISVFPQTVTKVLISGIAGYEVHDLDVKHAFELGYSNYDGTTFNGEITLYPQSLYNSFEYAAQNGYEMMIRSTTGLSTGIYYAPSYPDVKLFMPSGSNSFVLTYGGDIETCPVVVTGAGIDSNQTGYKIDFYSLDPITGTSLSSFSNGFIAGEVAYIANTLNCTIEEARQLSRLNASRGGSWDIYNGYGTIDVSKTITSPFPVELVSFNAEVISRGVILKWKTETELNNYGFEIERSSSSPDMTEWEKIGFEPGHGTTNIPHSYKFKDKSLTESGKYLYRLKQIDNDGTYEYSDNAEADLESPSEYYLEQNFPNPFNPATVIRYTVAQESFVNITLYDIVGNAVLELVNQLKEPGRYKINLNGSDLPSGIYFYRMKAESFSAARKLMLLK